MQLGALLPLGDIGGAPGVVREYAQTAEEIGYHFIEAPDHVLGANPAGAADRERTGAGLYHDPFVLFGYLAGCTTKLGFSRGATSGISAPPTARAMTGLPRASPPGSAMSATVRSSRSAMAS